MTEQTKQEQEQDHGTARMPENSERLLTIELVQQIESLFDGKPINSIIDALGLVFHTVADNVIVDKARPLESHMRIDGALIKLEAWFPEAQDEKTDTPE